LRPRFDEAELGFILAVLREAAAAKKQQAEALKVERERLKVSVDSLSLRLMKEGPYGACHQLKEDRAKLEASGCSLNSPGKVDVVLAGVIAHLEKIQACKRGNVPHRHPLFWHYLEELSALETQKAQISTS
jgi:hypothetical protein